MGMLLHRHLLEQMAKEAEIKAKAQEQTPVAEPEKPKKTKKTTK